MGRAARRQKPYRRAAYLSSLGVDPRLANPRTAGTYCNTCGERVYMVRAIDGREFLVTTFAGKAACRSHR